MRFSRRTKKKSTSTSINLHNLSSNEFVVNVEMVSDGFYQDLKEEIAFFGHAFLCIFQENSSRSGERSSERPKIAAW